MRITTNDCLQFPFLAQFFMTHDVYVNGKQYVDVIEIDTDSEMIECLQRDENDQFISKDSPEEGLVTFFVNGKIEFLPKPVPNEPAA